MPLAAIEDIRGRVGTQVGLSSWILIDQQRIDAFAGATEDRQFIHVDPELAERTPFGGTVAHGFLTLSLVSRMAAEAMLMPATLRMVVNYGCDRIRFLAPVRSGKKSGAASRWSRWRTRRRGKFSPATLSPSKSRTKTSPHWLANG